MMHTQDWTSLPGMFKAAGFKSFGSGKTYHDTVQNGWKDALFEYDGLRSWSWESLPYRNPCWTQGIDCSGCPKGPGSSIKDRWNIGNVTEDWCVSESGDLSDVFTTDHAIGLLHKAVKHSKAKTPFYLAVGYHKPHLPWIAKQKHFDMYPLESIKLAEHLTLDRSRPEIAFHDCDSPSPYEPLTELQAKLARRAYYAATTAMDEEIGRILDALDASGVADNTAIVLHSDHGWALGEHGQWRKNSNWENSLRVPFIISVPWLPESHGTRTAALAELIDIMPTMAELADIDVPHTKAGDLKNPIEGTSLVPALKGDFGS